MQHPLRQVLAAARALGDAERRAAAEPEIVEPGHRSKQRQAIGAVGDGAVDDLLDAGLLEDRHALHGPAQPGHQALEVVLEQFAVGIPRRQSARRPGLGQFAALVDADQAGFLLLAQVGGGPGVAAHGEFFASAGQFRHRARHQVMVMDVVDGEIRSHHPRHLPGETAGCVDHSFGDHSPLLRYHFPFAARQRVDAGHAVAPYDPGAHGARTLGHRLGQAERVGVAVVAGPGAGQHALGGDEGIQLAYLCNINDFHVVADIRSDSAKIAEPVQVLLVECETNAAAAVPGDGLTGQLLQFPVQGHAVFVDLGEVVVAHQVGALPGRVPGRARSQLAFLDQQDIAAPLGRELVQQAHAHDAAAYYDDSGMCLHVVFPQSQGILREVGAHLQYAMRFFFDFSLRILNADC